MPKNENVDSKVIRGILERNDPNKTGKFDLTTFNEVLNDLEKWKEEQNNSGNRT